MNRRKSHHYITTAIDYANGPPHLGHALEKIGADAMARYQRLAGRPVHFVIGMDEHGLKVYQSAEEAGLSPQEWVDDIADQFSAVWDEVSISRDDFIRTTQPRHRRAVEEIIARLEAAGDLHRDSYAGYYCVGCEAFKREDELERVEGSDADADAEDADERIVTDLRCPIHRSRRIIWTEETNWFFRLSRYEDRLLALLDERPEFVQPEARRNEIRNIIEGGLDDISVSRTRLPWGVPWPDDPDQTVYVWIDALTNYLSAIGFPDDDYRAYWPADVHVIGKDITRFHCIYWPAVLMSAGIELPRTVWAHGFVTYGGGKLSKTEGAAFELDDALERHGSDALRYYLLREVPWSGDGEVSWERFDARYTADLANDLGNLANRVLSMIERYRDGVVPAGESTALDDDVRAALDHYRDAMDAHALHRGAAAAMDLASAANGFVERRAPWKQAKDPDQAAALDATLASLADALAALACLLTPFMPGKMDALARYLGLDQAPRLDELDALDLSGKAVARGDVLFPRVE